jgi:hypothetical protein
MALTVLFALVYFLLTLQFPGDGLRTTGQQAGSEAVSFLTCLYFSVVTESTLGDGSISPLGFSRAIVGLQVLLGLVIFGILIAKLLSAPVSVAARINRMVRGDWVDLVRGVDGLLMLGVTYLDVERNGLCYLGKDYTVDGAFIGSFESQVFEIAGRTAKFTFSEYEHFYKSDHRRGGHSRSATKGAAGSPSIQLRSRISRAPVSPAWGSGLRTLRLLNNSQIRNSTQTRLRHWSPYSQGSHAKMKRANGQDGRAKRADYGRMRETSSVAPWTHSTRSASTGSMVVARRAGI